MRQPILAAAASAALLVATFGAMPEASAQYRGYVYQPYPGYQPYPVYQPAPGAYGYVRNPQPRCTTQAVFNGFAFGARRVCY